MPHACNLGTCLLLKHDTAFRTLGSIHHALQAVGCHPGLWNHLGESSISSLITVVKFCYCIPIKDAFNRYTQKEKCINA